MMEQVTLWLLSGLLWGVSVAAAVATVARRLAGSRPGEEDVALWIVVAGCWFFWAWRG